MVADLYKRALARAAEILGGREKLAKHLRTDLQQLQRWSSAASRPPEHALQSLVRILRGELVKNYKRNTRIFRSNRRKVRSRR